MGSTYNYSMNLIVSWSACVNVVEMTVGTLSAVMAYMIEDFFKPNAVMDFPKVFSCGIMFLMRFSCWIMFLMGVSCIECSFADTFLHLTQSIFAPVSTTISVSACVCGSYLRRGDRGR